MDKLFLQVLSMSITASYVIIIVIAFRLLLKKVPKIFSYMLWFAVLFRLIIPFSFESVFSLIPHVDIPQNIAYSPKPEINSGIAVIDSAVNNVLPSPVNPSFSVNPMQVWILIGVIVWVTGMSLLLIYSIFTTVKLYCNLRHAKYMEDNIYTLDGTKSPFVFGLINPKIYLPRDLSENEKPYILLHEQIHIRRLDHIVKPVFFIVTCIHWFNPLVWIAFYLFGEDMELSCDEKVIKEMGSSIKKEYSSSLLSMSTGGKLVGGCPLSFGENNTKGRIKNILSYKNPKILVVVILVMVVIVIVISLITNPKNNQLASVPNTSENDYAEELWDARTKYIGDNSAVGRIVSLLPVPENVQYDHFKLHTSEEPYEVEIVYSASSDVLKQYDTEESSKSNIFRKNALILLALVDNANSVRATLTDGKRVVGFVNGREWADYTVGQDVRNYAESPEKLQELIDMSLTATISNKDRVRAYLEEECRKAYSPYYELLDFIISDYHEEIVNGNIEAEFLYTLVVKNYDRDPDTVEYIKEAKESGNINYQQMYDEYLQAREMNFHFKTITDKNGNITLYSNISPVGIEWEKTQMNDYILK
ncbi:MAG TPA: DUF4825 domain-containing protein [Tissierellia bacterium]|nr:DUF4825 domain-containing protein [Tissierellia bacterium]